VLTLRTPCNPFGLPVAVTPAPLEVAHDAKFCMSATKLPHRIRSAFLTASKHNSRILSSRMASWNALLLRPGVRSDSLPVVIVVVATAAAPAYVNTAPVTVASEAPEVLTGGVLVEVPAVVTVYRIPPLVYADYYFLEALQRYKVLLD
jgi:hypothetical protein